MKAIRNIRLISFALIALAAMQLPAHAASLRAVTADTVNGFVELRLAFDALPKYEARTLANGTKLELTLVSTRAPENLALPQPQYPIRALAPYQGADNFALAVSFAGTWPYFIRRDGSALVVMLPKAFTQRNEIPLAADVTVTCESSSDGSAYRELYYTRITPDALREHAYMALASKHGARSMPLSDLAKLEGAALLVNTAYFDTKSGTPVSLVVADGKLVTLPVKPGRAALVVDKSGRARIFRPGLELWLEADGKRVRIQGFNQPSQPGMVVAYTPAFPAAKLSPDAIYYRLNELAKLEPLSLADVQKEGFTDSFIAVNLSPEADPMRGAHDVSFKWKLSDPSKAPVDADFAVCAAPLLVENGAVNITSEADDVPADIANSVRSRTAVGVDKAGSLIVLVVREDSALGIKGVSLDGLAKIMLKLGAVDALNLDGGGSSEFVLNGVPLNVPYGGERKIPVALALK
jgi:hypothetical protein